MLLNGIMRFLRTIVFILLFDLPLTPLTSTQAHPADVYIHRINLTLTPQGLLLSWEIKPGPMLASWLWNEADVNADESIIQDEAMAWGTLAGA